jgi:hypothetical protein
LPKVLKRLAASQVNAKAARIDSPIRDARLRSGLETCPNRELRLARAFPPGLGEGSDPVEVPIANLGGDLDGKPLRIKQRQLPDADPPREQAGLEFPDAATNRGDAPHPRDDDATHESVSPLKSLFRL